MLRRVACLVSLGFLVLSLSGCGGLFDFEEREPWRDQAEAACLRSGVVQQTPDIRVSEEISGPGVCGLNHPFLVSAFQGVTSDPNAPVFAFMSQGHLTPPGAVPQGWPGDDEIFDDPGARLDPVPTRPAPATGFRIEMAKAEPLSCPMVPALTQWLAEEVQPAALANFGVPIVEMKTAGTYNCRKRNNARSGRWSEHAFANAIDVTGFVLADGRETKIGRGWRGQADERAFWRDVAFGGCRHFTTVLGPGSDGKHENHLHLDLARHSAKKVVRVCRPRVPKDWVPVAQKTAPRPLPEEFTSSIVEPTASADDF